MFGEREPVKFYFDREDSVDSGPRIKSSFKELYYILKSHIVAFIKEKKRGCSMVRRLYGVEVFSSGRSYLKVANTMRCAVATLS